MFGWLRRRRTPRAYVAPPLHFTHVWPGDDEMTTEKERSRDNRVQANIKEDRDLDHRIQFQADDAMKAALDRIYRKEGYGSRAAWIRAVLGGRLRQSGEM